MEDWFVASCRVTCVRSPERSCGMLRNLGQDYQIWISKFSSEPVTLTLSNTEYCYIFIYVINIFKFEHFYQSLVSTILDFLRWRSNHWLKMNKESLTWSEVGTMKEKRGWHKGRVTDLTKDLKNHCTTPINRCPRSFD